jgi:cell division protein ZapA (FtsZ GTPase activity inhibitor)
LIELRLPKRELPKKEKDMKCGKIKFLNYNYGGLFRPGSLSDWFLALLIAVLLTHGRMPAWSQDSNLKLNGSSETSPAFELSLETLDSLRNQASSQLTGLTRSLSQAFQEVQTSKQQLTSLRNLLDSALQKSTDLESTNQKILGFNQQIGERLRERDTDLANAYDELDAQDKKILKMRAAIITLAGLCVLSLLLKTALIILQIKFKIKLPWIANVLV